MPYQGTSRLPAEFASKLGHLEVVSSDLIKNLVADFESTNTADVDIKAKWVDIVKSEELPLIFGVDGSIQPIVSETWPYKKLIFVKTALVGINQFAISKLDKDNPHPFELRDILSDSSVYHAVVFPLQHVRIKGMNTYHTIRRIIFDAIKDKKLSGEIMETLKWLAYEKWDGEQKSIPEFACPHCRQTVATLPYNTEIGNCPQCKKEIYLTDMLGFHQIMTDEIAPDSVAYDYMAVHETLLLFTGIRYFWETNKDILVRSLFVKDGPLTIRAQYSKLVNPIRRFFEFARQSGYDVCMIGQEKSGRFFDHLQLISKEAPINSIFIPDDSYIKEEIQQRPDTGQPYGFDTNYGAKVFIKLTNYHNMIINIPTKGGQHVPNPKLEDLIGVERIFGTIPTILSNKFEGALLPVEMAHSIASLSTYPSAKILRIFAEQMGLI
jgi:hypothetical protein